MQPLFLCPPLSFVCTGFSHGKLSSWESPAFLQSTDFHHSPSLSILSSNLCQSLTSHDQGPGLLLSHQCNNGGMLVYSTAPSTYRKRLRPSCQPSWLPMLLQTAGVPSYWCLYTIIIQMLAQAAMDKSQMVTGDNSDCCPQNSLNKEAVGGGFFAKLYILLICSWMLY